MRPRSEITRMTADGIVRCCTDCRAWLLQTTENYYQVSKTSKSHTAGEWSSVCRACNRLRKAEAYRRGAAGAAKESRTRDPNSPQRRPYDGHKKSWDFGNDAGLMLQQLWGPTKGMGNGNSI